MPRYHQPFSPEDLLRPFELENGIFAIGLKDKRITVYKQQLRALNLAHALYENGCIGEDAKDKTVAVIGGGFAGVTAAAAIASIGNSVSLFERRPVLCHLQHGCDSRLLHPTLYHWPEWGAESPYAGIPLLNWSAGTAAEVTRQILRRFHIIKKNTGRIKTHLGAFAKLDETNGEIRIQWDNSSSKPRGGIRKFDIVILAIGFGVERGVHEGQTDSYWRNDSINQPKPGISTEKNMLFFITGTGDGGLTDLLRVRIRGFNQIRIIEDLFPSRHQATRKPNRGSRKLKKILRRIIDTYPEGEEESDWLFNHFGTLDWYLNRSGLQREEPHPLAGIAIEKLNEVFFSDTRSKLKPEDLEPLQRAWTHIPTRLKRKLRTDTAAILNGLSPTFSKALSLENASLRNCLIAYHLYHLSAFSYVAGRSEIKGKQIFIGGARRYSVDEVVIRHGTHRDKVRAQMGLKDPEFILKNPPKPDSKMASTDPKWPIGWWGKFETPLFMNLFRTLGSTSDERYYARREFVPNSLISIATTSINVLDRTIIQNRELKKGFKYRMVLHRLTMVQKREMFQQISFYAGNFNSEGIPGRVFSFENEEKTLVKQVCRYRVPILIQKQKDGWPAIKELIGQGAPEEGIENILIIPFFGTCFNSDDLKAIGLLFMETNDPDFFSPKVLDLIAQGCLGLIESLDGLVTRGLAKLINTEYEGYAIDDEKTIKEELEALVKVNGIRFGAQVFPNLTEEDLTFHELTSISFDFTNQVDVLI